MKPQPFLKAMAYSFLFFSLFSTALAARKGAKQSAADKKEEQSRKFKLSKDKTNVDFEDANIDGMAKNPFGTYLNSRDQDFNRGFINIRKNWHDHMIMSVNGMTQ